MNSDEIQNWFEANHTLWIQGQEVNGFRDNNKQIHNSTKINKNDSDKIEPCTQVWCFRTSLYYYLAGWFLNCCERIK